MQITVMFNLSQFLHEIRISLLVMSSTVAYWFCLLYFLCRMYIGIWTCYGNVYLHVPDYSTVYHWWKDHLRRDINKINVMVAVNTSVLQTVC